MGSMFGVIVLGDPKVGKTHIYRGIINGFTNDEGLRWPFQEYSIPTIGIDFGTPMFSSWPPKINGKVCCIWDTTSDPKFNNVIKEGYIEKTIVQILVFDVTSAESLTNLENYIALIRRSFITENIILVGNKSDLKSESSVSENYVVAFMKQHGISEYCEVSCKDQMENGLVSISSKVENISGKLCKKRGSQKQEVLKITNYSYELALYTLKLLFNVLLTILSFILVFLTFPLMLASPNLNPFVANKQKRDSYFDFWGDNNSSDSIEQECNSNYMV